jgi:glycogen phosphorylase
MSQLDLPIPRTHIAYFPMEIALAPEMHTYSGGPGVLAGDTARACDLELPVGFVTLLSRIGHLRRKIDSGRCHKREARGPHDELENIALPLDHGNRPRWVWMMKEAISKIARYFNSQRMMRRYASEAYIR